MNKPPAKATGPTTRDFVTIADIRDGLVIMKNGSLRALVEVTSMNFELKSSDEQTAIIRAFQNFINSVDFPLQICVSSRQLDIAPYLKSLEEIIATQTNELLKIQAIEYSRFVKGLTELANIMAKKFYVVVPFYAVETPVSKAGFLTGIKSIFSSRKFAQTITEEALANYRIQLDQRVAVAVEGIAGLGLETKILDQQALTNLYYSYYNPGHQL